MRSEFEKLPQIESHLHNVVFDEGSNEYLTKKMGHLPFEFSEWFLNGAWSVYQHRHTEVDELQKRVDAFKEHAAMLREAAKSHVYTEREQNILLSQADDIDKILGLERALKGGGFNESSA